MTILVRSGVVAASRRYALELVRPSSVAKTGASSTADIVGLGSVDFGLCETLSLNGVFSAEYDNYMVVCRQVGSASSGALSLRLRGAGTDASATDYTRQYVFADGTSVTAARETSQTSFRAGAVSSSNRSGVAVYLYGPFLAQPTAKRDVMVGGFSGGQIVDAAGTHSLASSYDGLTILPSSGTITGNIAVYGLRG